MKVSLRSETHRVVSFVGINKSIQVRRLVNLRSQLAEKEENYSEDSS